MLYEHINEWNFRVIVFAVIWASTHCFTEEGKYVYLYINNFSI